MSKRYRDYSESFSVPMQATDVFLVSRELMPGNFTSEGGTAAEVKTFMSRWEPANTPNFIRAKDNQGIVATFCVIGGDVTPQGLLHVHQVTLDEPLLIVLPDSTSVQSTADSGEDALAFSVNTVNAWTEGKLFATKNAGVEQFSVSKTGGLFVGPNTEAFWGGALDVETLVSYRSEDEGNFNQLELGVFRDASNFALFSTGFQYNLAESTTGALGSGGTSEVRSVIDLRNADPIVYSWIKVESAVRTRLEPTVVDAADAIAYSFDTHDTLSNAGAKLAAFKNRGVEKLSIDKDGNILNQEVKVVGERVIDAAISNTPNSGDVTTDALITAIRDALVTHGLIAAA